MKTFARILRAIAEPLDPTETAKPRWFTADKQLLDATKSPKIQEPGAHQPIDAYPTHNAGYGVGWGQYL